MSAGGPACACARVVYDPIRHDDGSRSERWRCIDCCRLFQRAAAGAAGADQRVYRERLAVCAWLLDRIGQYDPASGIITALEDRFAEIRRGDHTAALAHGELDDLLARRSLRELAILAAVDTATEEMTDGE